MPQSEYWPFSGNKVVQDDKSNEDASLLQKQLGDMEGEVKEIQMELAAIRKNRQDLSTPKQSTRFAPDADESFKDASYKDIQDKFPEEMISKFEVSKLREELIRTKNYADEERFQREKYETKLKDLEQKLNKICGDGIVKEYKESRKSNDADIVILKNQIRDLKEELEETNLSLTEKNEQLQEYRMKYLQAQQYVEELKRQLDVVDFDSRQVSDQVQIEIQKMKIQFQEKLQELAPLPDLLKGAQIQLQEAKQLQKLAEDSSQQLSNELHRVKEKLVVAVNNLNQEKVEKTQAIEENKTLVVTLQEKQIEIEELCKNIEIQESNVIRLQEKLSQQEIRFKEKSNECAELLRDLDELRLESSRSLSRSKERSDSMRRYLQTQISEMERQLIQSRAQCRACQKERDEIRQRLQFQINSLQENFEMVEIRLRALQNQINSLKNNYTAILSDDDECNEINKITP